MLKLHNSLTRNIEVFKPTTDNLVRVYSCGPTVYDHVHVGNLMSFLMADTLNRVLNLNGFSVQHIMNLTDIDDKTISRSTTTYPDDSPEVALKKTTSKYIDLFFSDIKELNFNLKNINFVRATDSIEKMTDLITDLLDSELAYIADDGVYFSIEKYKNKGKKYGQLLDLPLTDSSQARINNDEYDKDNVHDFSLWKFQKSNEPAWELFYKNKSYLGRPGWHIECSVMSTAHLGLPFDIHTGGIDLLFPHHENEIAQSTAIPKENLYARFFIHNEHLLVNSKKMSKSLGNIYTLKDIKEKGYEPLVFRLFALQSHYRSQADFTFEILDSVKARLKNLRNIANLVWQPKGNSAKILLEDIKNNITNDINNDLNTPLALSELTALDVLENGVDPSQIEDFKKFIKFLDNLFGLDLSDQHDINTEQKNLIKERDDARLNNNWDKSDKIREHLKSQGIGLNDTNNGAVWYRI